MASQFDTAQQQATGGGQMPVDLGGLYRYDPSIDPDVITGTEQVTSAGPSAVILGVTNKGIEVQNPVTKESKVFETWNGKKAVKQVVDTYKQQMTGVDRNGKPTYTKVPDKYHWEIDTDVVPVHTIKDSRGNNVQAIQADAQVTTKKNLTEKLSALQKKYIEWSHSQDPKERAKFQSLQDKLFRGGFMGDKKPSRGQADQTTTDALNEALTQAARQGTSFDDTLQGAINNNPNGPDNKKKVFRDLSLTDISKVKAAAQGIAPDLIGSAPSDGTISKLAANYNTLELDQQNAVYDAMDASDNGGQSLTYKPPDLDTYVQQQLRAQNPVAANGMAIGQHMAEFMNLLGGSSPSASTFGGK